MLREELLDTWTSLRNLLSFHTITTKEINAIEKIENIINYGALPAVEKQNVDYIKGFQYYFNSGGVLDPSLHDSHRIMNDIVQGLYNLWNPLKSFIELYQRLEMKYSETQLKLTNAKDEWLKEATWWEKWENDDYGSLLSVASGNNSETVYFYYPPNRRKRGFTISELNTSSDLRGLFKLEIKNIYYYYRHGKL